ncbi:MAG: hypothetical protein BSR46_15815 [Candidatus Dactylopiibacterium carminicum]|uniref:hypothetical protein n=1 Tax=Candidatus Dactylopiibacterium carminicum TaxID=857335 RepID=UPI000BD68C1D|nr:hypothetical protein [Candidatus Dactylopiibacterium carminicum]PAS96146.1 MAG: hypothetical protein BSR46_15815 [Candidatus Dactylopiibacterium carminicum]
MSLGIAALDQRINLGCLDVITRVKPQIFALEHMQLPCFGVDPLRDDLKRIYAIGTQPSVEYHGLKAFDYFNDIVFGIIFAFRFSLRA